jgi:hypothetical protein
VAPPRSAASLGPSRCDTAGIKDKWWTGLLRRVDCLVDITQHESAPDTFSTRPLGAEHPSTLIRRDNLAVVRSQREKAGLADPPWAT